jgi:uncharacterized protein YndB with AHSA1/START domain
MEINQQAPAVALKEIVIAAAPETVWAVHTDIDSWPSWHPDITASELKGPLEPGSTFTWKSGPGSITSTLNVVETPRRVVWTGKAMGARAIHVWRLEPTDDGTRVVTEESMEGWPVSLLKGFFQKTLDRTLDAWLPALKAAVETRARS